jgi:transcriptional regulator with PAS, ATPase and Fis domain
VYANCNFPNVLEKLPFLVEDPYMGVLYIDSECRIQFINNTLAELLAVDRQECIGLHVNTVVPRSRLPQTIQDGEVNLCEICSINGRKIVVMRAPVYEDGQIIGAMLKSLFLDINAARTLTAALSSLSETDYRENSYQSRYSQDNIVGHSPLIAKSKAISQQVAGNTSNVLIIGESGTGKELFAQAIHAAGPRRQAPFIRINCACIPDNLLESELFGYDEGAFTGAKKGGKKGKFELADGGTIFMDEVSEMPFPMQAKLLSFLQEREFERVGGSQPITLMCV